MREADFSLPMRERKPRGTTIIREREREPDRKVIIDRDRN
jgi:hypothetical protein